MRSLTTVGDMWTTVGDRRYSVTTVGDRRYSGRGRSREVQYVTVLRVIRMRVW